MLSRFLHRGLGRRFAHAGFEDRPCHGHHGGPGRGRRGRLLDQGDLRLLCLHLLAEKPRHGYELIKAVGELMGGAYSPSPGVLYPTLSLLEELGYTARDDGGEGRKPYALTPAGRLYLEESSPQVEMALLRTRRIRDRHNAPPVLEQAMVRLKRALHQCQLAAPATPDRLQAMAAILCAAADSIEQLPLPPTDDTSMIRTETSIATGNAARYLTQLCKHWSHKFAVTFGPETGHIPFGEGRSCDLAATADRLTVRVTAPDATTLARLQDVVIDHLKRFAFREDLGTPEWRPLD
ncbi:DUF2218 domain-containing protein [Oleisolibacter albus]|uniref:DUF2218 domain-containing protein n=1 Tax=Oleisolibacter albus TaxID=2171757 RepID=UPI000DF2B301|nr:DUF2218 domain-containing protein [Oleisolibacter albus]